MTRQEAERVLGDLQSYFEACLDKDDTGCTISPSKTTKDAAVEAIMKMGSSPKSAPVFTSRIRTRSR